MCGDCHFRARGFTEITEIISSWAQLGQALLFQVFFPAQFSKQNFGGRYVFMLGDTSDEIFFFNVCHHSQVQQLRVKQFLCSAES